MLPRRIGKHMKEQTWFAVALDLVIVIAGVFIGLQVSNWTDAQRDERRAVEHAQRIQSDLASDVVRLGQRVTYWTQVSQLGREAIAYAEGRRTASDPWSVLLSFYQASQFNPYRANSTTYDELTSAGELALIRDATLRTDLAGYYRLSADWSEAVYGVNPDVRRLVRGLTPMRIQDHIWTRCYDVARELAQGFRECESPVSRDEADRLVQALAADLDLLVELRFWVSNLAVNVELAREEIEAAADLERRMAVLASGGSQP